MQISSSEAGFKYVEKVVEYCLNNYTTIEPVATYYLVRWYYSSQGPALGKTTDVYSPRPLTYTSV